MTLLLSLVDTHVGIFLTKKIFFRICPMIELLSCLLTLLKKKVSQAVSPLFSSRMTFGWGYAQQIR